MVAYKINQKIFLITLTLLFSVVLLRNPVSALSLSSNTDCDKTVLAVGESANCTVSVTSDEKIYNFVATISPTNLSVVSVSPADTWTKFSPERAQIDLINSNGKSGHFAVVSVVVKATQPGKIGSFVLNNVQVATEAGGILSAQQFSTNSPTDIRTKSSDANLSGFSVSTGTIDPVFTPDKTNYDILGVNSANITINNLQTVSQYAHTDGPKTYSLNCGPNNNFATITVTAEDGINKKTYSISAVRNCDSNALLAKLALSNNQQIIFNPTTFRYGPFDVPASLQSITVSAIAQKGTSTIKYNDGKNQTIALIPGENIIKVSVTAEDGTSKDYIITIKKPRESQPQSQLSSDSSLKSLSVSSGTLNFNKDVYDYVVTVPYEVEGITVNALTNHEKANAEISGIEQLVVGENKIAITVTAENGSKSTYTITINRQENGAAKLDNDSSLSGIVINDQYYIIDSNKTSFDITIQNTISRSNIIPFTNKTTSFAEIVFDQDMIVDKDIVRVRVTAEDLSTTTYTFNFSYPYKSATIQVKEKKPTNYIVIIITALVAIVLIGFLVYKILTSGHHSQKNKQATNQPQLDPKAPQPHGKWYNN